MDGLSEPLVLTFNRESRRACSLLGFVGSIICQSRKTGKPENRGTSPVLWGGGRFAVVLRLLDDFVSHQAEAGHRFEDGVGGLVAGLELAAVGDCSTEPRVLQLQPNDDDVLVGG